ncbi:MAG: SGNH/GDSL hydrolase family protein [Prevotella sp.]|nr:SGNH/GDSL hydrolase family protein [Prevotella sp.]
MKKIILTTIIVFLAVVRVSAAEGDSLRILWVGNSYTYYHDLPQIVKDIASSQRMKLSTTTILKGGEQFSGHLKNPRLISELKRGGWDYVVLQEQSTLPSLATNDVIKSTYPYAHTLDSMAKAGSPQVKVIYYMTWGHKYGTIYKTDYEPAHHYTTMQERLKTSYLEMAHMNNSWCAPVGMAWKKIRDEHPDYQIYEDDCTHPSVLGSYLAANVIFTTIYQRQYQTGVKCGIADSQAEVIQQTAQQTVLENLRLLNIK